MKHNLMSMNRNTNMDRHTKPTAAVASMSRWLWCIFSVLMLIVVSMSLEGCGEQGKNTSNSQSQGQVYAAVPPLVPTVPGTGTAAATVTVVVTTTTTTTPEPQTTGTPNYITPILATHEAFETEVTEHRQQLQTEVALTHAPTTTPGRPAEVPSPTPMLGMLPGCSNINAYEPQAMSCWRGVVDGQLVDVDAGREGLDGDPTQGIIRVHVWGQGQQGENIYQTPDRVGAVSIVSVSAMMFTLTTVDQPTPQQFVFDLANRSWVSP